MPNPKKLKATGDKISGYSNTLKSNNTTYVSNKDKLYRALSETIDFSLEIYELYGFLKKDFIKLKRYITKIQK